MSYEYMSTFVKIKGETNLELDCNMYTSYRIWDNQ